MIWPRGRYNGQRIVGIVVKVRLNVLWWDLRWPNVRNGTCLSRGPLHVWFSADYED